MSSRRRLAILAISTSAVACSAAGEFWRRALPARRMVSLVFSRMAMISGKPNFFRYAEVRSLRLLMLVAVETVESSERLVLHR